MLNHCHHDVLHLHQTSIPVNYQLYRPCTFRDRQSFNSQSHYSGGIKILYKILDALLAADR